MLALDLPDTVAVFNGEHVGRFGDLGALRTQGIANIRMVQDQHVEDGQWFCVTKRSMGALRQRACR